jgi:hypothetical protein
MARFSRVLVFSMVLLVAWLAACAVVHAAGSSAAWNRFRGPNGSGVAPGAKPPVELGSSSLSWKSAVPRGLSSPVLA